jgi:hypothetical protein
MFGALNNLSERDMKLTTHGIDKEGQHLMLNTLENNQDTGQMILLS